jgi:ribonuclease BN (tRNA processing enzyme)
MRIILGGVRGTGTVTDSAFAEFGGDTTAYLVKGCDGDEILIDFGSGLRELRRYLYDPQVHRMALMTHYHLDHLSGFPVFPSIYNPEASLHILGPRSENMDVKKVFAEMMARPFWPLQINMLGARLDFETLEEEGGMDGRSFGGLQVRWCRVHHPGGCMAYRLDEPETGDSLMIATDVEWQESSNEEKKCFLELCLTPTPVKMLFFDGHFMPDNYASFRNWGHSTWQDGVEIVRACGSACDGHEPRLIIVHHAPERDDESLREAEVELQRVLPCAEFGRQRSLYEGQKRINIKDSVPR